MTKFNNWKLNFTCSVVLPLAAFFGLSIADATPVLNENAASGGIATIYPDHANPALFYVAPNVMTICEDSEGTPRFSYQDLNVSTGKNSIIQMTICSQYSKPDLVASEAGILAKNPNAWFVPLPVQSSKMVFNEILQPMIVKQFCTHTGGSIGDEEACSFRLNTLGRKVFLQNILTRTTMVWQYEYTVNGFLRGADGNFTSTSSTKGLAVRIGGEDLSKYPELFRGTRGDELKINRN